VHAGANDYPFAVDLLDSDASRVIPVALSALNHPARQTPLAAIPRANRAKDELWVYIAAIALVLLIGEWFVYHRRL
jgi:hypothetical protein